MHTDHWDKVSDLFKRALPLSVEERNAFLKEACAGDTALRKEVVSLLEADQKGGFTEGFQVAIEGGLEAVAAMGVEDIAGKHTAQYEVLEKLGQGGMGVVYKARDTQLQRTVVLKFLSPEHTYNEQARQRFMREARAAGGLNHPNICTVHEINEDHEPPFIAMAYVDGQTLGECIADTPLAIQEIIPLFSQICEGLKAAHADGIVHRDIKPSNVMIDDMGLVKVMDFGIAQVEGGQKLTEDGATLGTLSYMSPEQATQEPVDHRTDIWSLGVMLYKAIAGELPFQGHFRHALLYAITNEQPAALHTLRPGIPAQLESLVAQMLAKNPEERIQTVDEVLASLQRIGETSDGQPATPAEEVLTAKHRAPAQEQQIGPYTVLRKLGDGGMGAVYLATPADKPYRQNVAVKVLKRGMDSEDILRRFRNERQILASLNHPNIAKLIDGGMTDDGRPYFVISYIEDALPIDAYCDRHHLPIADRLHLFQTVCDAVQYAHQNLIVHRDLKPSNILVSKDGTPHLLDFGIAKLLNPTLFQHSVAVTRADVRLMTPDYASPEQVRGEAITTSTDVYSLGVLLYKLLTGHPPYLLPVHMSDSVADVICNTDPERPSSVVRRTATLVSEGTETETSPDAISEARSTPTRRLSQQLSGDLDTIVMMALKKESDRRYPSVAQFAEDIERYLNDQPVVARKDTVGYRVRKFVGRHKVGVSSLAAIFTMLVLFGVVMAMQSARLAAERDRAEQALATSETVTDFLMGLLNVSNPWKGPDDPDTIDDLLKNGVAQAEVLDEAPEVRARVLDLIGNVYVARGEHDAARELLEQALEERQQLHGQNHEDIAASLNSLGRLLHSEGNYDQAEAYYTEALSMRRALFDNDHEAIPINLDELGLLFASTGQLDEAEAALREGIDIRRQLGENHPDMAVLLRDLGGVMRIKDNEEEAISLLEEALRIQRTALSDDHPDVARTILQLAIVVRRQGDLEYAERLTRESLEIKRKVFGDDHVDVAESLNSLAIVMKDMGRNEEAERLYLESLVIKRRVLGDRHTSVASTLNNLGSLLLSNERYAEAEPYYLEAVDTFRELFGNDDRRTTFVRGRLVQLYESWGRPELADQYR